MHGQRNIKIWSKFVLHEKEIQDYLS